MTAAPRKKTRPYAELRTTDGKGPRSAAYDDVYFSEIDGRAETEHVFLAGNELQRRFAEAGDRFVIGELGFGTGLNFLAALDLWRRTAPPGATLHFLSVEGFPLPTAALSDALDAWPDLAPLAAALVERYPPPLEGFHSLPFPEFQAELTLLFGEASNMLAEAEGRVDAWFLDGFAPARNPDMWSEAVFQNIAQLSAPGATAATYSVAGLVRRGLEGAGFTLQRRAGFGTKREMLTATLHTSAATPSKRAPWFAATINPAPTSTRIAIVGAGVTGACLAYSLRQYGYQPVVLDGADAIGAGASGNPTALVTPRLAVDAGPADDFHAAAFLYACSFYKRLSQAKDIGWRSEGVVQLALTEQDRRRHERLAEIEVLPKTEMSLLPPGETAEAAGLPVNASALFFRNAGLVAPAQLLPRLLEGAELRLQRMITNLERNKDGWRLSFQNGEAEDFDVVILANGFGATSVAPCKPLSLTGSVGQLTFLEQTDSLSPLQRPVTFGSYIAPVENGTVLGATYEPFTDDTPLSVTPERQKENLKALERVLPALAAGVAEAPVHGRTSIRCVTPDRAPVVGPMPDWSVAAEAYAGLSKGAKQNYPPAAYQKGLYVMTGFGSRGFATAPLAAAMLAAEIAGAPAPQPASISEALHPARFFMRALKRGKTLA